MDRCALEACEAISKAYVSTCPHQKRRVFNELHFWNRFGKFSFLSVFSGVLVWMINENASNLCSFNRKRISVDGASDNELSLSFLGNSRTSELRVRVWRTLPARKGDTRAEGRRKAGDVKSLTCFLYPYLLIGRRGKWNTLLFEKRSRRRLRWCCLSLIGRGECHRLDAFALAES